MLSVVEYRLAVANAVLLHIMLHCLQRAEHRVDRRFVMLVEAKAKQLEQSSAADRIGRDYHVLAVRRALRHNREVTDRYRREKLGHLALESHGFGWNILPSGRALRASR